MADLDTLREAKKLIEAARYRSVEGVAIGYKYSGGKKTDEIAVIVYVGKKVPTGQLKPGQLIPKTINVSGEEVKTDVVQGKFQALSLISFDRPLLPGYSIGHPDITAGTLGFFALRNNHICIVSNAHVLANINDGKLGDPAYYPGPYDGGTEKDIIGYLVATIPIEMIDSACPIANFAVDALNFLAMLAGSKSKVPKPIKEATNVVDCAASQVAEGVEVDSAIYKIGKPVGVSQATLGMKIQKSGRTSEYTEGEIIGIEATINVSYGPQGTAIFRNQIISDIHSEGGDSGSAVLTYENKITGLLFAGGEGMTGINPIDEVLKTLELELPQE